MPIFGDYVFRKKSRIGVCLVHIIEQILTGKIVRIVFHDRVFVIDGKLKETRNFFNLTNIK